MKGRRQWRRDPRPVVEALERRNLVSTLIPTAEAAGSLRDPAAVVPIPGARKSRAGRPKDLAATLITDAVAPLNTVAYVFAPVSVASMATAAAKPKGGGKLPYDLFVTGTFNPVVTASSPGMALMGGGTDVDSAFRWMGQRAPGGDLVVIRASGADGYNDYVYDMGDFGSVTSIVFKSRDAAFNPTVQSYLAGAEAIWIAGGDQANYLAYWQGTPVEDAVESVTAQGPVGGTSAGLAVLGEFSFSARDGTVTSKQALSDPYGRRVTLDTDFLHLPGMGDVITDSHFVEQDRMGRLVTFVARLQEDGLSSDPHGIGIDRETALLVEPSGVATVVGNPTYDGSAYFLSRTADPQAVEPRTPLTTTVTVQSVTPGDTFNLASWTSPDAFSYEISAVGGTLVSQAPGGSVYYTG